MRKNNVTEETSHYYAMRRLILSAMIGLPLALLISVLCITYYFFTYSIETSTTSSLTRIVEEVPEDPELTKTFMITIAMACNIGGPGASSGGAPKAWRCL